MAEYLSKMASSDEYILRLNCSANTENVTIWSAERPTEGRKGFLRSSSIMVWCGISRKKVVGSCFFEDENVNSKN